MQGFDFDLIVIKASDFNFLNQIQESERVAFDKGGEDYWTLKPMAEQQLILAAIKKDIICAHAILWKQWHNPKIAYLHSFVVNINQRGAGIGRSFFVKMRQFLVDLKIDLLELTLEKSNEPAKRIYSTETRLVKERFIENLYGPGEDRYHWTLDLRG